MPESENSARLIWIDLEMTGLDPKTDRIIEVATLITDGRLYPVAEGPVLAVSQPEAALEAMDEWNQRTHGESGLVERVRASRIDDAEAQQKTLEFLRQHLEAGTSPMCGNSVHQDRRFLNRYMPELEAFFHYRNLDVSTIKELIRHWRPDLLNGFQKKGSHQAMDDIRDSINELLYYREHFFRLEPDNPD